MALVEAPDVRLYFGTLALLIPIMRGCGFIAKRLGFPRVIGDMIGGILLGPSVLGIFADIKLFPHGNMKLIDQNGQLGLALTTLNAGLATDLRLLKGRVKATILFALCNFTVPVFFAWISTLFVPRTPEWRGTQGSDLSLLLILAAIFSVSSLPFAFLILDELKMMNDLGKFTICWSCLVTVGGFAFFSAGSSIASGRLVSVPINLAVLVALVGVMAGLQQLMNFWQNWHPHHRFNKVNADRLLGVICLTLVSSYVADMANFSFLVGAFIAGVFTKYDPHLRATCTDNIKWVVRWILMPQYFLNIGLQFDLRSTSGEDLGYAVALILLMLLAKMSMVPFAMLLGLSSREACFTASMSNCRGFNPMVMALGGLTHGILGPSFLVFGVLGSVVTCALTPPLCKLFRPREPKKDDSHVSPPEAENEAPVDVDEVHLEEDPAVVDLQDIEATLRKMPSVNNHYVVDEAVTFLINAEPGLSRKAAARVLDLMVERQVVHLYGNMSQSMDENETGDAFYWPVDEDQLPQSKLSESKLLLEPTFTFWPAACAWCGCLRNLLF